MVIDFAKNAFLPGSSKFLRILINPNPVECIWSISAIESRRIKNHIFPLVHRKGNTCCPIDNKLLIECEMFLDKIVRRSLRQTSSNAILQCREDHKRTQNQLTSYVESRQLSCPFKSCGCSFESNESTSIDAHSEKETTSHLGVSNLSGRELHSYKANINCRCL